jgi:hypothetical protein
MVAGASIDQRVAWNEERRALGQRLVWQQLDAAALADPLEQADFLLRRLYPEMPERWFKDVMAKLAAKHAAGEWHGFSRPPEP